MEEKGDEEGGRDWNNGGGERVRGEKGDRKEINEERE
jgi:hypothetical protein